MTSTSPDTLATVLADAPNPRRPLVAVLPFAHGGRDEGLRLFGSEVADHLREQLALDPKMQAILISSDFLAKAPPHAVDLICRELGVGHIISGTCHGDAAQPALYVELTGTREWQVRWARIYRGQARALLDPRSDAMAGLVASLRCALASPPRS